jgi:hypothetical protein
MMQLGSKKEISKRVFLASFGFFALFAFFTSHCLFAQQSRKAEVIGLGKEFELKIDQKAVVEGEGLTIVFESVLDDSRCPKGVDCIWSGNAKISIISSKTKQSPTKIELNTDDGPKSSSYMDYEIKLVALKPNRKPDVPLQRDEYRALLIISKK